MNVVLGVRADGHQGQALNHCILQFGDVVRILRIVDLLQPRTEESVCLSNRIRATRTGQLLDDGRVRRTIRLRGHQLDVLRTLLVRVDQKTVLDLVACLLLRLDRIPVVADGGKQKRQGGQSLLAIDDEICGNPAGDGDGRRRQHQRSDEVTGAISRTAVIGEFDDVVPQVLELLLSPLVRALIQRNDVLLRSFKHLLKRRLLCSDHLTSSSELSGG